MRRRLVTIPAVLVAALLLSLTAPLWLAVAWLTDRMAGVFRGGDSLPTSVLAAGSFVLFYLWCETAGILASGAIWLAFCITGDADAYVSRNYGLQNWWCSALVAGGQALFGLELVVRNADVLAGRPCIVMPRHASIADTVVPMYTYAIPRLIRLRFVMKKELLFDPCLDIVGNRIPNYFVDRNSDDSRTEVARVAALTENLGADDGVIIFPEGTRASKAKRARVLERLASRPEEAQYAAGLENVLPPQLGGPVALLSANPGLDLLFCAHSGFEGSSHFSNLFNGAWRNTRALIEYWRVPYASIPRDPDALRAFLRSEWQRMDRTVARLAAERLAAERLAAERLAADRQTAGSS